MTMSLAIRSSAETNSFPKTIQEISVTALVIALITRAVGNFGAIYFTLISLSYSHRP
jgi:hypothetical protein